MAKVLSTIAVVLVASHLLPACGKKKSSGISAHIPVVSPPVKAALPSTLKGGAGLQLSAATDSLHSRFFNANGGPSNIFDILASIDSRINGINEQTASSKSACVEQAPVAYTMKLAGKDETFYAQCRQTISGSTSNTGLLQFGTNAGTSYVYSAIGASNVAAKITPVSGTTDKYRVTAWLSVGYGEDPTKEGSGSYGLMQIDADSSAATFEFTAAGTGLGYCGAQLRANTANLYAVSSADMGKNCGEIETNCVKSSDGTTAESCDATLTTFELTPIGRTASANGNFGATAYPDPANLTFDGTASDPVHFGPTTATPGVGAL